MEEKIKITTCPCPNCGHSHELLVYPSHLEAWKSGRLIQNALTELNADERELLISGICPKCWDEMFK